MKRNPAEITEPPRAQAYAAMERTLDAHDAVEAEPESLELRRKLKVAEEAEAAAWDAYNAVEFTVDPRRDGA